ncbi:MAG: AAA family ATPase, partial [Gammaproteobacteria bacterium]
LPVVLVVGMRLGCLNHALLSAQSIRAGGCRLAGWVANSVDPDCSRLDANIAALRVRLAAPLLGIVPYLPASHADDAAAGCLDADLLGGLV